MRFIRDVIKKAERLSLNQWLLTLCDLHWLLGERNHTQIIIETEDLKTILMESAKHPAYFEFRGYPLIRIQEEIKPSLEEESCKYSELYLMGGD